MWRFVELSMCLKAEEEKKDRLRGLNQHLPVSILTNLAALCDITKG